MRQFVDEQVGSADRRLNEERHSRNRRADCGVERGRFDSMVD